MVLRKVILISTIKIFRSIVDKLQENLIYAINHVNLGKRKVEKILKTSDYS